MFNLDSFFQSDNTNYQAVLSDTESGDAQLVDIREKMEWDRGHFNGAIHVPLSKLSRGIGIDKLKMFSRCSNRREISPSFRHVNIGFRLAKDI